MEQNGLTLTREELYNAIWKTPMSHLCKTWGITINRLSKICEQFDIPRPKPDYWPLLRLCDLVNCETIFSEKWLTHLVSGFGGQQSVPGSGARLPQ